MQQAMFDGCNYTVANSLGLPDTCEGHGEGNFRPWNEDFADSPQLVLDIMVFTCFCFTIFYHHIFTNIEKGPHFWY